MASFLYCFPFSYRSSNYCDSNSCRSCTLLKALAKSNGNLIAIAFKSDSCKSDNFRERAIKKEAKNQKVPKRMQKRLKVITLQGAIEKSPILLSQYWKNEWLDGNIVISYFDGSNNICIDVNPTLQFSWWINFYCISYFV